MKNIFSTLRMPAFTSSLLVLPFAGMELTNRHQYGEAFPFPLFVLLWLLPFLIILVLPPVIRQLMNGTVKNFSIAHFVAVIASVLLAASWITVVIDQLPCFLGYPNCD